MLERRYTEEDDRYFRELTVPEEDRAFWTTSRWDGSFRWFRSENVVCLEQYRRQSVVTVDNRAA